MKTPLFILGLALSLTTFSAASAKQTSILVQSTTSTANSGLYEHLLPQFEKASGIKVNVVAVGTGQAIRNATNCDADVLLVHAKSAEEKFVRDGYGVQRFDVMYNDFVIVGSPDDPAAIKGTAQVTDAFKKIAQSATLFASRGDNSGTHQKERALWSAAGVDPTGSSGKWYRETGSGMGSTLNIGVGMGAYVMTDRATWISFKNKGNFAIVVQGDQALFNQYGVILVNPKHCPTAKAAAGQEFIDWLLSVPGQTAIAAHQIGGKQLFFPNAQP